MHTIDDYPKAKRYLKRNSKYSALSYDEMVEKLSPTGNEDVALMDEVLRFAVSERESKGRRFKMSRFFDAKTNKKIEPGYPPCGTSACLAGTATLLTATEPLKVSVLEDISHAAGKKALGLNATQANYLFYMTDAQLPTIVEMASFMVGKDLRR